MNNALNKRAIIVGIMLIFIFGAFLPYVNSRLHNNFNLEIEKNQFNSFKTQLNEVGENLGPSPLNINDPWWNPGWNYRKEIIINHSMVDGNLSNFPVLFSVSSDGDLSNPAKCQVDGDDIIFTDVNGVQLSHEIEFFNNESGRLIAWIKVSSLLSDINTSLYMYYGNPSITNQQNITNVWDSNFTLVQHLEETSDIHYDSTSYNNDGTAQNGLNQSGIGIIDGADTFDANDDYIDCGNESSLEPGVDDFTFEAWIKRESIGANHCIVCKRASTGVGYIWWIQNNNVMRFFAKPVGTTFNFPAGSITDSNWHHVAITLDRDNFATVYVDSDLVGTKDISIANGSISSTKFLSIGREVRDDDSGLTFDGSIDEVRISNSVRNNSWIKTEYNNQLNPASFYIIDTEEEQPAIPIVYDPFPPDNSIGVSISLLNLTFSLSHKEGALMDYWVETSPNIGSDSTIGVGNGTYSVSISGLTYETTYIWYVNVTDGNDYSNASYDFTVRSQFVSGIPSNFNASAVTIDQVDLVWTLGVNCDRTYVEWNSSSVWSLGDGTFLYNDSGTGTSHSGLDAHTTYYYQAWGWNETDGIFSSVFASDDATTWNTVPSLGVPDPVNGSSGVDLSLTWSVSVSDGDGDSFDWSIECSNGDVNSSLGDFDDVKELDISGLDYDTVYTVWVNVSDGFDSISEWFIIATRNTFIPDVPSYFSALTYNRTQINLSWINAGENKTYIEYNTSSNSWTRGEGIVIYNNTDEIFLHTGLNHNTVYYYLAWSYNVTDNVFSISSIGSNNSTSSNSIPLLSGESPSNNSMDVNYYLDSVSVFINDADGDIFDWSIEVSSGDSNSTNGDNDGIKSCSLSGPLNYKKLYTWWVNVTDGIDDINMTFYFTTEDQKFWDVELNLTETSGLKDYVIFGEASNASDGQDSFDVPKPSPPPEPYVYAWFDAGLNEPYNILWRDYRKYPDDFKVWNLSILWASSGDDFTNITISWNSSDLFMSEYNSIILKDITFNFTVDMLTLNNYTYNSTSLIVYDFQIICSISSLEYSYNISLNDNWNLVSLPVNESFNKDNITVNYLGVNYSWDEAVSSSIILDYIYSWNATNQKYEIADIFDPGQGYWVYAYYECDLWISSNASSNDLITNLLPLWNLAGLPHNIQVAKENITVYYNGTEYTWQKAVNNFIILDYIYGWNANNQNYEITDILRPGKGFWIYAYYNCTLKI